MSEEFNSFYNKTALQLAQWALEENDRVKASRLWRIAQKLEYKDRKAHGDLDQKTARRCGGYYQKPCPLLPVARGVVIDVPAASYRPSIKPPKQT